MDRRHRLLRALPIAGAVVLVVLVLGGIVTVIHGILASKNSKPGRTVQVVQVIRPPPPPPEETPPPPPEKVDEPLPQQEAEPAPSDAAAPSEQLGLDAEGAAGGDSFGLAARKGGRDIVGSGGAAFAWYTGILKDQVIDRLSADQRVRSKRFSIVVRVWIAPDGTVRNARLANSSGSKDLDLAIESVLGSLGRLREGPPLEMPQPVSLRVVSRS